MLSRIYTILFFITGFYYAGNIEAQQTSVPPANNLTLVYDIHIRSHKSNTGIEETYNGGIKTFMASGNKARIRLVTLMRIQSIYFLRSNSTLQQVLIAKESGLKKYKYRLSPSDWRSYNNKYNGISYKFENGSLKLLGYHCKKAVITLKNGKQVVAYYTTALGPSQQYAEPLFAGLPGVVLQYELESKKGVITYTASKINFDEIDEKVFAEPGKEYAELKYDPSAAK